MCCCTPERNDMSVTPALAFAIFVSPPIRAGDGRFVQRIFICASKLCDK